ncbi:protein kinase domain-containing protein [Luteimonas sp. e5]
MKKETRMPMGHEQLKHWQAADAAFDTWLGLDEAVREEWLATQDFEPAVMSRLQRMIEAYLKPSLKLDPLQGDLAGRRFGSWVLERELGRGGMAVVWLGHREHGPARQQAAVKILTLAALGADGRERFKREAEILARLNHPNITPLIDCGSSADGSFWMAMPLVEGERIDQYCDQQKLDARAIVKLGLQVCDAVACAHRNLVVHRDLKPSNVLVEEGGHVRLLDFGIGQFTDSEDEPTRTLWRALTPGYAAPEQLQGAPPSTAIDIYGLGALLHRLLTGQVPCSATEPSAGTRPSLLVRQAAHAYHRNYAPLKNDLDRVLLKALAEDPAQRYASVDAMAEDLRRWLAGMPVHAQKPRLGYRLRKFAGRHKTGVAAAALVLVSLAGGIGATLWQAGEARREAERARIEAHRAEQVRDFLAHVFSSTEPRNDKGVPDALDLLEEGARRAREEILPTDPGAAADILLLTGYARMHLSQYDAAAADLEQAAALFPVHRPDAHYELWRAHDHLSQIARVRSQPKLSLEHARAAEALTRTSPKLELSERLYSLHGLAMALYTNQDFEGADRQVRIALEEAREAEGVSDLIRLDLLNMLAITRKRNDIEGAELLDLSEQRLQLAREVHAENEGAIAHTLAQVSRDLIRIPRQSARALELAHAAADAANRVYAKAHYNKTFPPCNLGNHLAISGQWQKALPHFEAGIANARAIGQQDYGPWHCLRDRGYVHAALGQYVQALEDITQARLLMQAIGDVGSESDHDDCGLQASILLRMGRADEADAVLVECANGSEPVARHWHMARAEWLHAHGRHQDAAAISNKLREELPRSPVVRQWIRPWMLSALLAHESGDHEAGQRLAAELGEHATLAPVSACLGTPDAASCLGFP